MKRNHHVVNPYEILRVPPTATREEIRKAYRQLQMRYHPDKNMNSEESILMTQQLNHAYEILSNPAKRKAFDLEHQPTSPPTPCPPKKPQAAADSTDADPLATFFQAFAAANNTSSPDNALRKPVPIFLPLHVQLAQVYAGASMPVEIERWNMETGIKTIERETVYVTVPSGVDDNEILVLREKGNVLHDQLRGDVKLTVKLQNNTPFERRGLDLVLKKTVTLREALCGFSMEFRHLNGKSYHLNSTPGSVVTPEFRKEFVGMGLRRDEHKGNLWIEFHVQFPESLSSEQVQALSTILP